jgi:alkanesulfonate monooxygenase SsuD/methylene tetrahydromethanopterin reductase-like flavin-dependent oxidoreductase (luciferase family)
VPSSHLTADVVTAQAAVFRRALAARGKSVPRDLPLLRNVVVAPDRDTALRDAGSALDASYRVFGQWGLFTDVVGAGKPQPELAELVAGRVVLGSPEACAAELRPLLEAGGFTRLVCRVQWMGLDQRVVLRTIGLLAERVLPLLRRAAVGPERGGEVPDPEARR